MSYYWLIGVGCSFLCRIGRQVLFHPVFTVSLSFLAFFFTDGSDGFFYSFYTRKKQKAKKKKREGEKYSERRVSEVSNLSATLFIHKK
jgi:hypothetical protein